MSYKDRIADNNGEYEIPMFPGDAMIDFAYTFRRIEAAGFSGHYMSSYGTLDDLARGWVRGRGYLVENCAPCQRRL